MTKVARVFGKWALVALAALVVSACDDHTEGVNPVPYDATAGAKDGAGDAPHDGAGDAPHDAASDAPPGDAGSDAAHDAPADAAHDAEIDAGPDAAPDANDAGDAASD